MSLIRSIYRKIMIHLSVGRNVVYHGDLHVGRRSLIMAPDELVIGRNVIIGINAFIAVNGSIGNGVLMSSYVGIVGRYDHDFSVPGRRPVSAPWVFDKGSEPRDDRHRIVIGDDVFIGFGAVILSGITIGRGAVIGAGAVVVKDVEPYEIVAGNPARSKGYLFSGDRRAQHEASLLAIVEA